MKLALNEAQVRQTIHKNTATSYGLTLVVGMPFPAQVADSVQRIRGQLEAVAPRRFTWYGLEHLHATLIALLRGRYRDSPPLQQEELPADLQGFTRDLTDFFVQHHPFTLDLAGVHITPQGFAMIGENTLMQQLASSLQRYPELDPPKRLQGLHVTIGYFNTDRPFATEEERVRFEATLAQLTDIAFGSMTVEQVWLVHYANRTLNRMVGKVAFSLGQTNVLDVERLLQELGIYMKG